MKNDHLILRRLAWRMRTGAFGFYVDGPARLAAAAGRSAAPLGSLRPRGRTLALACALVIGLPIVLWIANAAESTRVARQSGIVEGRPVGEVASLEGSLERYYKRREAGRFDGSVGGREVAVSIEVTGYTSRSQETDDTPFTTAANTTTRPGVIALSRDLLKRYTPGAPFEFGDIVHVSGLGDFIVEDSMAHRWHHRADIWFGELAEAKEFGRHKVVITGPYGLTDGQTMKRSINIASAATAATP